MTVENHLLRAYRESKRKPPHIYPPAVVPGYGQYIHEAAARKVGQIDARHDRSRPQTMQGGRSERLPYKRRGRNRSRWD